MKLPAHAGTILLAFAAATTARATTYTWSATDGNFSTPTSWTGPAPAPTGSPTDQLVFPAGTILYDYNSYTATVDTPTPWTLNSLTLGTNDTTYGVPSITINANPGSGLSFAGPNPTITTLVIGDNYTINAPISSASDLTLAGAVLNLTGPLSFSTPSTLFINDYLNYQNNSGPTGLKQTVVTGSLDWTVTSTSNSTVSFSFGSAPIVLQGGGISLNGFDNTAPTIEVSNPLIVAGDGGSLGTDLPPSTTLIRFTGPISLHGQLGLNAYNSDLALTGPITLNQSGSAQPTLWAPFTNSNRNSIAGNITDDPDPTHTSPRPLALVGPISPQTPDAGLSIDGTDNTYSVGTEIQFGHVSVSANSSLGTGNVTIDNARLTLSALTNIAPGRTVLVSTYAALSITFDHDPSSLINPDSSGTLALDTTFTTPLDMSKIGNGLMTLGTSSNATYAATSLLPDADHVYRFTPASYTNTINPTLTVLHSVLTDVNGIPSSAQLNGVILAAPNSFTGGSSITGSVYANAPGALGTGNVTIGQTSWSNVYNGTLYLNAPNAYAPSAQVNVYATLAAIGPNGSIPFTTTAPIFHPGAALVLGDNINNNSDRYPDNMPLALHSSTLVLNGIGNTTETVGPLSFSGLSTIVLQNPNTGSSSTILHAPSLVRQSDHAILFIIPFAAPLDPDSQPLPTTSFNPNDPINGTVRLDSAPTVTNGIVAPWMQFRSFWYNNLGYFSPEPAASFLTYTPHGFALPTYTSMPTNGGTGTEVVDNLAQPSINIATDASIYALRTSASVYGPLGTTPTLHILSGGLIASSSTWSPQNSLFIQPNIDFGAAEAYINTDAGLFSSFTMEIAGQVTATNGLTKFGTGNLLLSNPNNQIAGPITIAEGTLTLAALPAPNSSFPIAVSDAATLSFLNPTTLSRPIHTFISGSYSSPGATITSAANQSLTIAAPVTGNTGLTISAGGPLNIAAPIAIAGGLSLTAPQIHLAANISTSYLNLYGYPGSPAILTGSGVISSPGGAYISDSTLSPGNTPGDLATLTFDASTTELTDSTSLDLDLSPTGLSDRILFTGSLTIDAFDPANTFGELPLTLNLHFLSPPTGQIYTLLSASSLTGTFSNVTGVPPNYTLDYTPTSLLLIPTSAVSAVPEPTTLSLLTLSLTPLLARRRRKTL